MGGITECGGIPSIWHLEFLKFNNSQSYRVGSRQQSILNSARRGAFLGIRAIVVGFPVRRQRPFENGHYFKKKKIFGILVQQDCTRQGQHSNVPCDPILSIKIHRISFESQLSVQPNTQSISPFSTKQRDSSLGPGIAFIYALGSYSLSTNK